MASGGNMAHRSTLRRINPENELFSISTVLLCGVRLIEWLDSVSRSRTFTSSRLLYTTLPLVQGPLLVSWVSRLQHMGYATVHALLTQAGQAEGAAAAAGKAWPQSS